MTDTSKKKTLINDPHVLGCIQKCFFCSPFQGNMRAEKILSHFLLIICYRLKYARKRRKQISLKSTVLLTCSLMQQFS